MRLWTGYLYNYLIRNEIIIIHSLIPQQGRWVAPPIQESLAIQWYSDTEGRGVRLRFRKDLRYSGTAIQQGEGGAFAAPSEPVTHLALIRMVSLVP